MKKVSGITILGKRDLNHSLCFDFVLNEGAEEEGIKNIVNILQIEHHVLFSDPEAGECYREIKRTRGGFQTKRGCHGSSGTWKDATEQESIEWILPVAKYNNNTNEGFEPSYYMIRKS